MNVAQATVNGDAISFTAERVVSDFPGGLFAVAPEARSFYAIGDSSEGAAREVRVVVNWLDEVLAATETR